MKKITNIFSKTILCLALIFLGCLAFTSQSLADYQACSGWSCCRVENDWSFTGTVTICDSYSYDPGGSVTTCGAIQYDAWGNASQSCTTASCSCDGYVWVQVPTVTSSTTCTDNGCAANTCVGSTCDNDVNPLTPGTKPCNGTCGTTGKLGSPPIVGSCSVGTPSDFKLDSAGHWSWICSGSGGTNASCSACVDTCTPNCTSNIDTKCKDDASGICQILNYTTSCLNYGANGKCNAAGTACTCVPNEDCNESNDACKSQACDSGCFSYGSGGIIQGTRRCVTIDNWKEVAP